MKITKTGKAAGPGRPTAAEWIEIMSALPPSSKPKIIQHNATDQRDEDYWNVEWTEQSTRP